MKKLCVFIAVILLFILMTGCKGQPVDPTISLASDNPTKATEVEINNSTTAAEEESTSAILRIEEEFYNLINTGLYKRALGCTFEKPEDIPAWFYFYNGVSNREVNRQPLTEDEWTFLTNAWGKDRGSDIKLPVAEINKDLSILGVTIADIQIPEDWVYYDKTDSYYFCKSDIYSVSKWFVTKVEQDTEGIVAVYWENNASYVASIKEPKQPIPGRVNDGKVKMVMTLQQQADGAYRVLSNLPQE